MCTVYKVLTSPACMIHTHHITALHASLHHTSHIVYHCITHHLRCWQALHVWLHHTSHHSPACIITSHVVYHYITHHLRCWPARHVSLHHTLNKVLTSPKCIILMPSAHPLLDKDQGAQGTHMQYIWLLQQNLCLVYKLELTEWRCKIL